MTGGIRTNHNDRKILEFLLQMKVATVYQMLQNCPVSYKERSNLVRRLNQLAKSNYIEKHWANNKRVYSLGKRGIAYFMAGEHREKMLSHKYLTNFSQQIEHDLLLTDIYGKLKSLPIAMTIETHNEQLTDIDDHKEPRNIPDAKISFESQHIKGIIVLELELSVKAKKRYIRSFEMYYKNEEIGLILYLVHERTEQKALLKVDSLVRLGKKSRAFIGLVSHFLNDPLDAPFLSSDDRTFRLKQVIEKDPSLRTNKPKMGDTLQ